MLTEDVDRQSIRQDAIRNKNVLQVTLQKNVDGKTWRRMLQDEFLDKANEAKVKWSNWFAAVTITGV